MTTERYIFHNTQMKQGANWEMSIICEDNNGDPIDISNYTSAAHFRTSPGGTLILEASTENDKIVIDGPNGGLTISLGFEDTDKFPARKVYYDVFIQNDSETQRNCLVSGEVEVIPKITVMPAVTP